VNNQELMAGWARERLIAVHGATPAPGGDVTALAHEVAQSYGKLAAFLPEVQPPPGNPGQWAPEAVVKAGAAVIGVLDELRTPEGPGKSHDLPELFFAASVQRTLTGGPDAVTAACVSALTGDAERLWARAFGKLLVYAISVPVVGLIDDLTGMLAEAVAARRWINLQRQLMLCGKELESSPAVGLPGPVESPVGLPTPAAVPDGPAQVPPSRPGTPSASRTPFPSGGPVRSAHGYKADSDRTEPPGPTPEPSADRPGRVSRSSTSSAGTSGSPRPPSPPNGPKPPGGAGATEPPGPRPEPPSTSDATTPSRPQSLLRPLRGVPPTAPGTPENPASPPAPPLPITNQRRRSVTSPRSAQPHPRTRLPRVALARPENPASPRTPTPTPPQPNTNQPRQSVTPSQSRPRSQRIGLPPPPSSPRTDPPEPPGRSGPGLPGL